MKIFFYIHSGNVCLAPEKNKTLTMCVSIKA